MIVVDKDSPHLGYTHWVGITIEYVHRDPLTPNILYWLPGQPNDPFLLPLIRLGHGVEPS